MIRLRHAPWVFVVRAGAVGGTILLLALAAGARIGGIECTLC